ncbi:hypothetical protein NFI96_027634 [Prochilodus magdalenae]|nr:hypothetical protein NFI96_027634 [Prochilodus magdalenae]
MSEHHLLFTKTQTPPPLFFPDAAVRSPRWTECVCSWIAESGVLSESQVSRCSPLACPAFLPPSPSEKAAASMRVLSSLLMVLLLCTSLQLASSGPASIDNNQDCCFKLTQMKIPLARIKSYWWTSSSCYIKAVVFQTEVRGNLCVDPAASWVCVITVSDILKSSLSSFSMFMFIIVITPSIKDTYLTGLDTWWVFPWTLDTKTTRHGLYRTLDTKTTRHGHYRTLDTKMTRHGRYRTTDTKITRHGHYRTLDTKTTRHGHYRTLDTKMTRHGHYRTLDTKMTRHGRYRTLDTKMTRHGLYRTLDTKMTRHGLYRTLDTKTTRHGLYRTLDTKTTRHGLYRTLDTKMTRHGRYRTTDTKMTRHGLYRTLDTTPVPQHYRLYPKTTASTSTLPLPQHYRLYPNTTASTPTLPPLPQLYCLYLNTTASTPTLLSLPQLYRLYPNSTVSTPTLPPLPQHYRLERHKVLKPNSFSVSLGELSPARMRTLSALLVVALICSLQQVYGGIQAPDTVHCCSDFFRVKIPLRRIKSYSHTSSDCPLRAVIICSSDYQMALGESVLTLQLAVSQDWTSASSLSWLPDGGRNSHWASEQRGLSREDPSLRNALQYERWAGVARYERWAGVARYERWAGVARYQRWPLFGQCLSS